MSAGRVLLTLSGALLAWALFFGDGDSANRLAWIGGGAVLVAALASAAAFSGRIERPHAGRFGVAAVSCFAALVAWQGISLAWSVQPDRSWDYVNRGLAYLAFLALGLFVGALVPRAPRAAAAGFAALLALVLGYAFLAKGIPALYPDYGRLARLRSPVGFWNALALLGDFALVLGLWRSAQRRVDGVLLVFAAALTVLLAYSRGGVVIAVIAAAAWLALDRRRLESLLALVIGGAAALAVAGISLALHGVSDDKQPHSARVHDGRLFLLAVVIAAVVAGVVGRVALRLDLAPTARRRATAVLFGTIVLGGAGGIAGAVLHHSGSTSGYCTQGAARLSCGSSDARLDWWKQSLDMFRDKPLAGTGAGSFQLAHRLRRAAYTAPVTEPHNLALQSLGETGIVGFLLLVGAAGFGVVAVRRRLRDDAAVALAICALAYGVHVLVDIGYDFVAVSAPFFAIVGVLLADGTRPIARREPVWAFGALLLAAAVVLSFASPYIAQRKVDQAVASENPDLAAQAHSWNPVSIVPLETEAALEQGLGHKLQALQLYREAVDTQPDNPEAWVELGLFQLDVRKDACGAFRSLSVAYGLDRYNPAVALDGGPLDVARVKARKAGCR